MSIDRLAICPTCGQEYRGYPAVSRKDGISEICPDCGMREALEAVGFGSHKIEAAIAEVQRWQEENAE